MVHLWSEVMLWQLRILSECEFSKKQSHCKYVWVFDLGSWIFSGTVKGRLCWLKGLCGEPGDLGSHLKSIFTQINHFHFLGVDFLFANFKSADLDSSVHCCGVWGHHEKESALSNTHRHPSPRLCLHTSVPVLVYFCFQCPAASFGFCILTNPKGRRQCPLQGLFLVHYWLPVPAKSQVRFWGCWVDQYAVPALLDSVKGRIVLPLFTALKQSHLHWATSYPSTLGWFCCSNSCPPLLSPTGVQR